MNAGDDTLLFGASGFGEAMVDLKAYGGGGIKTAGGRTKDTTSAVHLQSIQQLCQYNTKQYLLEVGPTYTNINSTSPQTTTMPTKTIAVVGVTGNQASTLYPRLTRS
jgi:hypothetical protein